MFENSADFFGRIIVYSLDILGEKASWPLFFTPSWDRIWPLCNLQDSGWCGGTGETCHLHCHLLTDVNVAFFGMDTFEDLSQSLFITQEQEAWHEYWNCVLFADLNGFVVMIRALVITYNLYVYCAFWVQVAFKWNKRYKNTFILNLLYRPLLLSSGWAKIILLCKGECTQME